MLARTSTASAGSIFRDFVTGLLANRLTIEEDIARHPEILDVPIERPLFITGLPRSGTTFLHRLMSEDPAGRTLLYWESICPSPPPEPETYRTDPRSRRSVAGSTARRLSPGSHGLTNSGPNSPRRTTVSTPHDFRSRILGFLYEVRAYGDWLSATT